MLHLVREIQAVSPFCLTLKFNTGEVLRVDLESRLRAWSQSTASQFTALLDPVYFQTVKWHAEMETVYWENGIDLCPDLLYAIGKEVELGKPRKSHRIEAGVLEERVEELV